MFFKSHPHQMPIKIFPLQTSTISSQLPTPQSFFFYVIKQKYFKSLSVTDKREKKNQKLTYSNLIHVYVKYIYSTIFGFLFFVNILASLLHNILGHIIRQSPFPIIIRSNHRSYREVKNERKTPKKKKRKTQKGIANIHK